MNNSDFANSGVKITSYQSASDFLSGVQESLLQDEVANGLMLGICLRLQREAVEFGSCYLATIEDEQGELVLAALMTPPHNLVLSSHTVTDRGTLTLLVNDLVHNNWLVPGVLGPTKTALAFAQTWTAVTGQVSQPRRKERVFQLKKVILPSQEVPGRLRVAQEADVALLEQWMMAFVREALPEDDPAYVSLGTADQVRSGNVFVWELPDGRVVSMAMKKRPVVKVISVSFVYTPPEYRGHGYASHCVAALSQQLLENGWELCSLFTDLANPTSNKIYQQIGYQPVMDIDEYTFKVIGA